MSTRCLKDFILLEIVIQSKLLAVYGCVVKIGEERVCLPLWRVQNTETVQLRSMSCELPHFPELLDAFF